MPLIHCPVCKRITYAVRRYDDDGDLLGYKCTRCRTTIRYEEASEVELPHNTVLITGVFTYYVARLLNTTQERVEKEYDEHTVGRILVDVIARELLKRNVEVYYKPSSSSGKSELLWKYAAWSYTGTPEGEELNDMILEDVAKAFADAVNEGFMVFEIAEQCEGDSIFIAVRGDGGIEQYVSDILKRVEQGRLEPRVLDVDLAYSE